MAAGAGRPVGSPSLLGEGDGGQGGSPGVCGDPRSPCPLVPHGCVVSAPILLFWKIQGRQRCSWLPPLCFCHCRCPQSCLPHWVLRLEAPGWKPWLWGTKGARRFSSAQCYLRPGHENTYCCGKKPVAGQIQKCEMETSGREVTWPLAMALVKPRSAGTRRAMAVAARRLLMRLTMPGLSAGLLPFLLFPVFLSWGCTL